MHSEDSPLVPPLFRLPLPPKSLECSTQYDEYLPFFLPRFVLPMLWRLPHTTLPAFVCFVRRTVLSGVLPRSPPSSAHVHPCGCLGAPPPARAGLPRQSLAVHVGWACFHIPCISFVAIPRTALLPLGLAVLGSFSTWECGPRSAATPVSPVRVGGRSRSLLPCPLASMGSIPH